MARITDETRIDRIRQAAMQLVVNQGYSGASISAIAKTAGVAEGYLYRFYKGKAELVNDLFNTNLEDLARHMEIIIGTASSTDLILAELLNTMYRLTNETPERIKFLYVLMHDYNFSMPPALRDRIFDLCRQVLRIGQIKGEIGQNMNEENIYLLCVAYPISFINSRLKGMFYNQSLSESDLSIIRQLILKALKD